MKNPVYFEDSEGRLYYLKDGIYLPLQIAGGFGGGGRGARGAQGIQGPVGPSGSPDTIESGTFTRLAIDGSGNQIINTIKKAKLIFFSAQDNNSASYSSTGIDDSINASSSTAIGIMTGSADSSFVNSISVGNSVAGGGNGYTAKVTAILNSNYTITWVAVGIPNDVNVQWHAITG